MMEPCLAISLWPPGGFKPREGSSAILMVRADDDTVRIDRPPDQSAWELHSDLDDYIEGVLAVAVETYWRDQGRVVR